MDIVLTLYLRFVNDSERDMINGRHKMFSFLRNSQMRELISWFIEVYVKLDWKPPFEIYDMQEETGTKVKRDKRKPAINWEVVATKREFFICRKLIHVSTLLLGQGLGCPPFS